MSIQDAVHELRRFVETLRERPDIEVRRAMLPPPADPDMLAQLAATKIPQALIDLYALVDGIHIEWRFIEPDGEGCMRIPPASRWTVFTGEDNTYMGFGDDREALLLDEVTPEGSTWLVRDAGSEADAPFEIVFASAGEGSEGVLAAGSIEEYLRLAMASGFVPYWPRCFRKNRYVSYATQERHVERFRAPPVVPAVIRADLRVHVTYFSEGGRGRVIEPLHEAPPSRLTEFAGTHFALVALDLGFEAYLPHGSLKVLGKPDAYEGLRDPSEPWLEYVRDDAHSHFHSLARAMGPLSHYSNGMPSNARLAAGLLSARPFDEALQIVLELRKTARREGLDLDRSLPLEPRGDETDPDELARHGWKYTPKGVLIGLFGGLTLLARNASYRRGVPARVLFDIDLVRALADIPEASLLHAVCEQREPLTVAQLPHHDPAHAEQLGLPPGSVVLLGGGF